MLKIILILIGAVVLVIVGIIIGMRLVVGYLCGDFWKDITGNKR